MNPNKSIGYPHTQHTLLGRRIILTRTEHGNETLRNRLELHGAQITDLPAVYIAPPESWDEVDKAARNLASFKWVVFTSSNGVTSFFRRLLSIGRGWVLEDIRTSHTPKFACVGPTTAAALVAYGLECSLMPDEYLTDRLAESLAGKLEKGGQVLLARSEIANKKIDDILASTGASISELTVYRTLPKKSYMPSDLPEGATDIVFASPSAVGAFSNEEMVTHINSRRIDVHCIGPVTAKAAVDRGMEISTVSNIHTAEGLVNTIVSYVESRQ
ncbi:MAG: uroporphyrinogen-III synthase [Nitrososphaerota archaeon]|nr:uroporphyrinogen-III synthase [Nitrososphaerota archaeon]